MLTRALGVRSTVQGDLIEMSPRDGDVFAMMSDGLTNHVSDAEIAMAVTRSDDLQQGCNALVDFANDRGGDDNITVVLVKCEKAGAA